MALALSSASRDRNESNNELCSRRPGWKKILAVIAVTLLSLGSFMQLSFASSSMFDAVSYSEMVESIIDAGTGIVGEIKGQSQSISFTAVHRKEVQDALDKLIAEKTTTTTTEFKPRDGIPKRVDLTKNYPRIQDYLKESSSPVERTIHSTGTDATKESNAESRETKKDEPLNIVLFYADDWTMKVGLSSVAMESNSHAPQ
eukprot:scaffold6331_cov152-Amphora_coffeaeformis.AAC.2